MARAKVRVCAKAKALARAGASLDQLIQRDRGLGSYTSSSHDEEQQKVEAAEADGLHRLLHGEGLLSCRETQASFRAGEDQDWRSRSSETQAPGGDWGLEPPTLSLWNFLLQLHLLQVDGADQLSLHVVPHPEDRPEKDNQLHHQRRQSPQEPAQEPAEWLEEPVCETPKLL